MASKVALLFEDDPLCRNLMTEILMEKDYVVTAFADPTSYVANSNGYCGCSDTTCADALITDNQMPGMSGIELIQWMADRGCKLPNHRRALISGSWSKEEQEQALHLGCKIFQKPAAIEEIHQWLDGQR